MVRELQCMGREKYQFLKPVVGILFPQQTYESILSKMLHLAYDKLFSSIRRVLIFSVDNA